MAACSSSASDDTAAAGSAGDTSAGGTSSGGTSSGGTGGTAAGAAGAADECSLTSDACTTCLGNNCQDQEVACTKDEINGCDAAFGALLPCVCGGDTVANCEAKFKTDGGSKAADLTDCFDANCATECGQ